MNVMIIIELNMAHETYGVMDVCHLGDELYI